MSILNTFYSIGNLMKIFTCIFQTLLSFRESHKVLYKITYGVSCFVLLLSCSADTANHAFEPQTQKTSSNEDLGINVEQTEAFYLESLSGTWLHWSEVSTCVKIGEAHLEQINRTLFLVDVEHLAHQNLIETWTACQIELTPVFGQQARIPDALKNSVYPLTTLYGYALGANQETQYTSGPMSEIWGLSLENETIDDMPTMIDDPRIIDQDKDNQPGVTLEIGDTCQAYLTQRRITHYLGSFVKADEISGMALSQTEQFIVDASSGFCKTPYQTRANPQRSHFKRFRIDGKGGALDLDVNQDSILTCDEILPYKTALFQIMEVNDERCDPSYVESVDQIE